MTATVIAWPGCCCPVVAHGAARRGRSFTVVLHGVECDEPVERRRSLSYIERRGPHERR